MRGTHRAALAALPLSALLGACGAGGGPAAPAATAQATPTPTPAATATTTPTPVAKPVAATVFFVRGAKAEPVSRQVGAATLAHDAAMALLRGPTAAETQAGYASDVPAATRLNGVSVDGGVATVDLSADFTAGAGDSQARRVTQVVDTLTELDGVHAVLFRIDGKAVATLGGITLSSPAGRDRVEQWNPAVLVETPLFGETVRSPLRIAGTADTFEAVFRIRLVAGGTVLVDEQVQATSGTGTRGSFDASQRFTASGAAVLTAYVVSMKDGSHTDVVSIPLTLQP